MSGSLYHYTSHAGFRGIISTGTLRATHYRQLKGDPTELTFGVGKLREAIKRHPAEAAYRQYREYLLRFVDQFADGELPVYVASLSEIPDSPHHWKNYAPDGVAIAFNRQRVSKGFPLDITRKLNGVSVPDPVRPDPSNRLWQCRYAHQTNLTEVVAKRFFTPNSYPAAFGNEYARNSSAFSATLAVSVYRSICELKPQGYEEDAEWRCVHIEPDPIDYPVLTTGGAAPFIEMRFDPREFVEGVMVGAHGNQDACRAAVKEFRDAGLLTYGLPIAVPA